MIELRVNQADPAEWDGFVENHPEGRFCQLFGYRCVERVYGYKPWYLTFESGGRIVGVLPCFEGRSLLFGRRLLSQPFSEYGGFLIEETAPPEARRAIVDAALQFVRSRGGIVLETHGNFGMQTADPRLGVGNRQQFAYLDLQQTADHLWNKGVSRHVRKAVRKAEREGLECVERSDEQMLTEHFYPLYLRSMKRLGSPPHPAAYFLECAKALNGKMRIYWALHEDKPIAGLLGYSCGRRVSIVTIVSDERYWHLRPNDMIHWEYIKWACESGYRYFDFGSVRYDGQAQFKEKWGCVITDSSYVFLSPKDGAKHESFDSSSGNMALAQKIWSKWVPQSVTPALGPTLRKHLLR